MLIGKIFSMGAQVEFMVRAQYSPQDLIVKYELIIYWDAQDKTYVAEVPELPGCMAHGETYEKALKNANEATKLWIVTAKEFNHSIPESKGRRLIFA
jgi:predicted RNase H-like HicB family nuclease